MSRHVPFCAGDDWCDGNCRITGPKEDLRERAVQSLALAMTVLGHRDNTRNPILPNSYYYQSAARAVDDIKALVVYEITSHALDHGLQQLGRDNDH